MKAGSAAENFMFFDLFVKELNALHNGIKIVIVDDMGITRKYFVQARAIMYQLDTKALEYILNIKAVGQCHGCVFCRAIQGTHLKESWGKTVYIGHRSFLHLKHVFRTYGITGKCCVENYYNSNKVATAVDVNLNSSIVVYNPKRKPGNFFTDDMESGHPEIKHCLSCNDRQTTVDLQRHLRDPDSMFLWAHPNHWFDLFRSNLWPSHCDFRKQNVYRRQTNTEFMADGAAAKQSKLLKNNTCKGPSRLEGCTYFDVEHNICPGAMHAICGVVKILLKALRGEDKHALSTKQVQYCKARGIFPTTWAATPGHLPYILSKTDQTRIELALECLVVPKGIEEHKRPKEIFTKMGYMKSSTKISLLTIYLPILLTLTKIDPSYRAFFSMLSLDIIGMLSTSLTAGDVDVLNERLVRFVVYSKCSYSATL
jgi:hypothetical protein